jgi:hypothetical protein
MTYSLLSLPSPLRAANRPMKGSEDVKRSPVVLGRHNRDNGYRPSDTKYGGPKIPVYVLGIAFCSSGCRSGSKIWRSVFYAASVLWITFRCRWVRRATSWTRIGQKLRRTQVLIRNGYNWTGRIVGGSPLGTVLMAPFWPPMGRVY